MGLTGCIFAKVLHLIPSWKTFWMSKQNVFTPNTQTYQQETDFCQSYFQNMYHSSIWFMVDKSYEDLKEYLNTLLLIYQTEELINQRA
jgi:hypothetical protein